MFLKNAKQKYIRAPIDGYTQDITKVQDVMFAEKMIGDGIAIHPSSNKVYAPIDGILSFVMDSGHAFGITNDEGIEVLVHIGIDTVQLKGKYFQTIARALQRVTTEDAIIEFDSNRIEAAGYDITTMVICTNTNEIDFINRKTDVEVKRGEQILSYTLR